MKQLQRIAQNADAGRRVKYLVRGDMGVSYHQFASLKMKGGLRVNGIPVHANHPLSPGDVVTVILEDAPREAVAPDPTPVDVLYEDDDLLIIDKPAPLACQCSPKQAGMTLENRLAWRYRDDPGFVFRPLNRLDRGTSGLMAAAKNAHAAQLLQRQLHTDQFVREYLAVVEGVMTGSGTIDAPIAKADAATVRRVIDWARGKPAVTHYRVERTGDRHSLVRLRLETGRTHQIRVHLARLGHPIAGDFLYGAEDPRLPHRFALHSTYIKLTHPITGEIVERESTLPEPLGQLLNDCGHKPPESESEEAIYMILKTARLVIRPVREDDWKSVKAIWEGQTQSRYAQYDKPKNTEDDAVRAKTAGWAAHSGGTAHMYFAVCLRDAVIGYVVFNARANSHEVGYCFHSDYHGKGYAREGLSALLNALSARGIRRFTAGSALDNTPSVKLLLSLGFRQIGTEQVSFYRDAEGNDIVFTGGIFELTL